jgi:hypothetical protein
MAKIQIKERHSESSWAYSDVRFCSEPVVVARGQLIRANTAVTIASWWQSPGSVGSVLAGFASGAEVDTDELLEDIEATHRMHQMEFRDSQALARLVDFVKAHAEGKA